MSGIPTDIPKSSSKHVEKETNPSPASSNEKPKKPSARDSPVQNPKSDVSNMDYMQSPDQNLLEKMGFPKPDKS